MADPEWLSDPEVAPLVRHNLRLYYARWLAQYGLYDEVLHHIGDLRPPDVVDPASLLFYQMVAYHQLVRPDDARAAMVQLLERDDAPRGCLGVGGAEMADIFVSVSSRPQSSAGSGLRS